MMKRVKATMLLPVVFLLTILFTGAPGTAWADGFAVDRTVLMVRTYEQYAVIEFSPAYANNLSCGTAGLRNSHAAILWNNNPDGKGQLATALMAMAANMKIGLGIQGCFAWGGGIPKVYRIDVGP